MAADPSLRLRSTREFLQLQLDLQQAAAGQQPGFGADTARWLSAQLPGSDPAQLGWGLLAVVGLLYPDERADEAAGRPEARPGRRWGERTTMLLTSRVAEAMIESAGLPPDPEGPAGQIGPELAALDMLEIYAELSEPRSAAAPGADPAVLRAGFHRALRDELGLVRLSLAAELPGADAQMIGWALIGTGMSLLMQTRRRRPRPGSRRGGMQASQIRGALFLAMVGDFLVRPD